MMNQNNGQSHARHLSTLADLAAKSWRNLFEGKQYQSREMRKGILEASLNIQRHYTAIDMRNDTRKPTRAENMKGLQGLLHDVGSILVAVETTHGRRSTKRMQANIDRRLAVSRAHHFPNTVSGE